jgi:hypothetical protein
MTPGQLRGGVSSIAKSNGEVIRVPEGANGPIPAEGGKGFQFTGGSSRDPLSPRVAGVRVMDPVTSGKYPYPNGFNEGGQAVNPFKCRRRYQVRFGLGLERQPWCGMVTLRKVRKTAEPCVSMRQQIDADYASPC